MMLRISDFGRLVGLPGPQVVRPDVQQDHVGPLGARPRLDLIEHALGPPAGSSAVVLVEVRVLRCAGLHTGEAADEVGRVAPVEKVVPQEVPVGRVAVVAFGDRIANRHDPHRRRDRRRARWLVIDDQRHRSERNESEQRDGTTVDAPDRSGSAHRISVARVVRDVQVWAAHVIAASKMRQPWLVR